MPRPWRTVHRSPHKIVMVKPHSGKPRNQHRHTTHRHTTTHVQKETDLSWVWPLVQLAVAVVVVIVCVDILITALPYLFIAAIIGIIIAG